MSFWHAVKNQHMIHVGCKVLYTVDSIRYLYWCNADVLQLNVCRMVRSRKKGYIRNGDYIEVRVKMDASYREVVEASVQQLGAIDSSSSEDDEWSGEAVLVRANGTVILDRPIETTMHSSVPWEIGSYMKTFTSFVKSGVPVKLGIGFVPKVR